MFKWGVLSLCFAALCAVGCGSDYNLPDVLSVDALDSGDAIVGTVELSETSEDAFTEDIPVDVHFVIHFDETMDLSTAQENIWIEDAMREQIDVNLSARLQDITVRLAMGDLEPGQNHVLHIGDDIKDVAGWELVNGYDVSFYTAP